VPISLSGGNADEMERSMDPRITWANPQARSGKDPCKFHPLGVELRRRWAVRRLQRWWWRLHDCVTPNVAAFHVHADGSSTAGSTAGHQTPVVLTTRSHAHRPQCGALLVVKQAPLRNRRQRREREVAALIAVPRRAQPEPAQPAGRGRRV
jgi:hypothetical protein